MALWRRRQTARTALLALVAMFALLASGRAQSTANYGAFGRITVPAPLLRPPFWRQELSPCGLSTNESTGVRPNRCANNIDFCFPDVYQPAFLVCTPCWKACLQCTRYDTPWRNDSGITTAECSACGCSPNTNSCSSSRSCRTGSYCDRWVGKCLSCYECVDDADVREGSCRAVCGHSPRPQLPQLFGLPYDPNDGLLGQNTEWVIDAAVELSVLFKNTLGTSPAVGWYDLGSLLTKIGLDFMPPEQLRYAVRQLTRANSTYSGYIPTRAPRAPPPSTPPPDPPSPPRPSASPSPSPSPTTSNSSSQNGTASNATAPAPPSPAANGSTSAVQRRESHRRLMEDFLEARRQLQSTNGVVDYGPSADANPATAPIYPEDMVRVFLFKRYESYEVFCPPDDVLFRTGVSYPGCACIAIPAEYQQDNSLVSGSTKQWIDYLTMVAGSNATSAKAMCPQGFRCSSPNFAYMKPFLARAYMPSTMGMCVPCLVGEYCPSGTVEKNQELLETCTRRSALAASLGSSNSSDDCGNTRLCPAGSFCPLPSRKVNCTNGDFCTEGSTEPVTCDFDQLINNLPFVQMKPQPTYVLKVVTDGSPLSGNYCPENSQDPFNYCPGGYYCPQPGQKVVCPKGHFCPAQSVEPQRCSFLLACNDVGISSPNVAAWGFAVFVILMLVLPVAGIMYNFWEEKAMRRTAHDDKLLEALSAMGFAGAEDSSSDEDEDGYEEEEGWLRQAKKPRGAWRKFKYWFRRRVLGRRHEDDEEMDGGKGGRNSDGKGFDEEKLMVLGADRLPPGYDKISPYLTIQFENLTLYVKSGRRILDHVSGDFPHSHLHAIMGPSGSGKSSFITALIGKAGGGTITGNVTVWKCESQEDELGQPCLFEEIRYLTGFVPQDDVVHDTMTVRENLDYSAALRLPRGTPRHQRETAVRGALSMLGMAHVQHDIVGNVGRKGLSGGQRKRLNIGLELVAKPSLLMLDEPTSGLDAAVSHDVVLALKYMAEAGMNVMVVIHQPRYSIFEMFDSVLLLGVGGRTVFLGPVNLAEAYFNFLGFRPPPNENRADFYLDVISGAVWRDNDEDFVPNELFTVWQEVGRMWLIEKLTNPDFGEEEEEGEDEDEEDEGEWEEDHSDDDEDGHHHHHHHAGAPYAYDSDVTSGGRRGSGADLFAATVAAAVAASRSASTASAASGAASQSPSTPHSPGPLTRAALEHGSMTHQRSRFAPDRVNSGIGAAAHSSPVVTVNPLALGQGPPTSPPQGAVQLSAATAAAAAGAGAAAVAASSLDPALMPVVYISPMARDNGGQPPLLQTATSLEGPGSMGGAGRGGQRRTPPGNAATALLIPPIAEDPARAPANLPLPSPGALGEEPSASDVAGGNRALNKVESLRAGMGRGGGEQPGDIPSSRRFLEKVESLKEAGVSTLAGAASAKARDVLAATGKTSMSRRVGRTGSNVSVDLGAAAAAAVAAVDAERAAVAAAAGRPMAPPVQVLMTLGPSASGRAPEDKAQASQRWKQVRENLPLIVASGAQAAEITPAAKPAFQRWRDINIPAVVLHGKREAAAARRNSGDGVPSRSLSVTSGVTPRRGSATNLGIPHQPGSGGKSGANHRSSAQGHVAGGPSKISFWDVAAVQLEEAHKKQRQSHGGDARESGPAARGGQGPSGGGAGPGGAAGPAAGPNAAPGAVDAKRPGGPAQKLSMADILKMAKQHRASTAATAATGAQGRRTLLAHASRKGGAMGANAHTSEPGIAPTGDKGAENPTGAGGAPANDKAHPLSPAGAEAPPDAAHVKKTAEARTSVVAAEGKGPKPSIGMGAGAKGGKDILLIARQAAKEKEKDAREKGDKEEEKEENPGRALLDAYRHSMRKLEVHRSPGSLTAQERAAGLSTAPEGLASGAHEPFMTSGANALLGAEVPMLQDDEDELEEMVNRIYAEKPRVTHLSKIVPWRPKDLQAIHDNFDLLDVGGNKELSYEEFLYFFASLRKLLPERRFKQFVEETIDQFDLHEDTVVTRDEFLAGIKTKLKEAALPQEFRRRKHKGHGQMRAHERMERKRRLNTVLRRIRKLPRQAPTDHISRQRKPVKEYFAELQEYFRNKNLSITMKHHAAKAAKAAGAANPIVAARLHSVAAMQHSMYMQGPGGPLAPQVMAPAGPPPLLGMPSGRDDVVTGGQTLLFSDAAAAMAAGAGMHAGGPFAAAYDQAGAVGGPYDEEAGGAGSTPAKSHGSRGVGSSRFGTPRAAELSQPLLSGGSSSHRPGSARAGGPRAPRARRASGLGLPSRMSASHVGPTGSVGTPGGRAGGEVEMGPLGPMGAVGPDAAASLGAARERELARMLGIAPPAAASSRQPSGRQGRVNSNRAGAGADSDAGAISGVEGSGGSVARREGSAALRHRRLQVVLTPAGRVSTDVSDTEIAHVRAGRVNKSVTGRGGSVSGRSGSVTGSQGNTPTGHARGPSMSGVPLAGGRVGSITGGGRHGSITAAMHGRHPVADPHIAQIVAAANRMGSITGGGRVGSVTGGRAGVLVAGGRVGSITAGTGRVGSITAGGARAPGVMVIGGGRVGSITATGRIGSITGAQHAAARRRQRQLGPDGEGADSDAGYDDPSAPMPAIFAPGGLFAGGSMPRADKESLQAVLANMRAKQNLDPEQLKKQEQEAQRAAAAAAAMHAGPRPPGGGRQRRQSWLLANPDQVALEMSDSTQQPVSPTGLNGAQSAALPAQGSVTAVPKLSLSGLPTEGSGMPPSPLGRMGSGALQGDSGAPRSPASRLSRPGVPLLIEPVGAKPGSRSESFANQHLAFASGPSAHMTPKSPLAGPRGVRFNEEPASSAVSDAALFDAHDSDQPGEEEDYARAAAAGGGGGGGGDDMGAVYGMPPEQESLNCCVLLSYYISYYSQVVWQWFAMRVRHFVASLLGHERGGRALPSVGRQMAIVWRRSLTKFLNERAFALLDISLVIMLGLIMGAIQGHVNNITKIPETAIIVILAFALTTLVTGLRTFGQEQLIYLTREAQAGLSVMSWMLGRIGWDLILQGLYPALYLGFYYAMTVFDTPFEWYYLTLFFVAWWGFGVGYLFSVLLEANNALLGGLCITLIFGGIINGINPSVADSDGDVVMTGLQYMSYSRWAVEAVYIATATPTPNALVFLTAGSMAKLGFCDMNHKIGAIDGGLSPDTIVSALAPLFEKKYNTTLTGVGNTTSGDSETIRFMYQVYENPKEVDSLCRNAFIIDLVWLFSWGMITRLATYLVLLYKVERRMTTASVFG